MPRISYVSSESFRSGEQDHSPENENMDLCRRCWPKRRTFLDGLLVKNNLQHLINTEWVEYNDEGDHPDYDDCDYSCDCCNRVLTLLDN